MLGETEVSPEVFKEYLEDLKVGEYRESKYDLVEHNSNMFTNEIAQFLLGKGIE